MFCQSINVLRRCKTLIDWQNINLCEPPLLADISADDLEMLVASGDIPVIDFRRYLPMVCHTEAVEQCIKLVMKASASVWGENARDGFIAFFRSLFYHCTRES